MDASPFPKYGSAMTEISARWGRASSALANKLLLRPAGASRGRGTKKSVMAPATAEHRVSPNGDDIGND
jgi:hypothetical protein